MGFNWHHTLSETLHGNRWSWLSLPSLFFGAGDVKITWNANNAFSSRSWTSFLYCHESMVQGSWKGFKRQWRKFFFQPSTSYLTRQCTFVPSMLISLTLKVLVEKKKFFWESFSVFRIDSGCKLFVVSSTKQI